MEHTTEAPLHLYTDKKDTEPRHFRVHFNSNPVAFGKSPSVAPINSIESNADLLQQVDPTTLSASKLSKGLDCAFCRIPFKSPPSFFTNDGTEAKLNIVLLPCFSCVCKNCHNQMLTRESTLCSICKMDHKMDDISSNLHYVDINHIFHRKIAEDTVCSPEAQVSTKCDNCSEKAASQRCIECKMNFCVECVTDHVSGRFKRFHSHELRVLGGNNDSSSSSFFSSSSSAITKNEVICPLHPLEKLKWFCYQCKRLLCSDCVLSEGGGHVNHDRRLINEASASLRFDDAVIDLQEKKDNTLRVIDDFFNELREALDEREAVALYLAKKETLANHKQKLTTPLNNAFNCINVVEVLVDSAGKYASFEGILELEPYLSHRIDELERVPMFDDFGLRVEETDPSTGNTFTHIVSLTPETSTIISAAVSSRTLLNGISKVGVIHDNEVYPGSCLLQGEIFGGVLTPGTQEVLCTTDSNLIFSVITCKEDGTCLSHGGLLLDVRLDTLSESIPLDVLDRGDGTYNVDYCFNSYGITRFMLKVRILGVDVCGSPVFLRLVDTPAIPDKCISFGQYSDGLYAAQSWILTKLVDGVAPARATLGNLPHDKRSYWCVTMQGLFQSGLASVGICASMEWQPAVIKCAAGPPHGGSYGWSSDDHICVGGTVCQSTDKWLGFESGDELIFCYDPLVILNEPLLSVRHRRLGTVHRIKVAKMATYRINVDLYNSSSSVSLSLATLADIDSFNTDMMHE
eukprot:gene6432-13002_t